MCAFCWLNASSRAFIFSFIIIPRKQKDFIPATATVSISIVSQSPDITEVWQKREASNEPLLPPGGNKNLYVTLSETFRCRYRRSSRGNVKSWYFLDKQFAVYSSYRGKKSDKSAVFGLLCFLCFCSLGLIPHWKRLRKLSSY